MKKQITCKYCGKTVIKTGKPSYFARNTNQFCSPSCRNKARVLESVPCPICETPFRPYKHNGATGNRKTYCSRDCASIASRGIPSVKKTPAEVANLVKSIYPANGAEPLMKLLNMTKAAIQQIAYDAKIKLNPAVYRQRVHESARTYMRTSKNPGYISGHTCKKWGSNWIEQRRAALKRDNSICQYCGKCGRSIHHIKPRRLFSNVDDANALSNLITLCASDHKRVEMGKIPCPHPK